MVFEQVKVFTSTRMDISTTENGLTISNTEKERSPSKKKETTQVSLKMVFETDKAPSLIKIRIFTRVIGKTEKRADTGFILFLKTKRN